MSYNRRNRGYKRQYNDVDGSNNYHQPQLGNKRHRSNNYYSNSYRRNNYYRDYRNNNNNNNNYHRDYQNNNNNYQNTQYSNNNNYNNRNSMSNNQWWGNSQSVHFSHKSVQKSQQKSTPCAEKKLTKKPIQTTTSIKKQPTTSIKPPTALTLPTSPSVSVSTSKSPKNKMSPCNNNPGISKTPNNDNKTTNFSNKKDTLSSIKKEFVISIGPSTTNKNTNNTLHILKTNVKEDSDSNRDSSVVDAPKTSSTSLAKKGDNVSISAKPKPTIVEPNKNGSSVKPKSKSVSTKIIGNAKPIKSVVKTDTITNKKANNNKMVLKTKPKSKPKPVIVMPLRCPKSTHLTSQYRCCRQQAIANGEAVPILEKMVGFAWYADHLRYPHSKASRACFALRIAKCSKTPTKCVYPGCNFGGKMEVDHIIELIVIAWVLRMMKHRISDTNGEFTAFVADAVNSTGNIQPMCPEHNRWKGAWTKNEVEKKPHDAKKMKWWKQEDPVVFDKALNAIVQWMYDHKLSYDIDTNRKLIFDFINRLRAFYVARYSKMPKVHKINKK